MEKSIIKKVKTSKNFEEVLDATEGAMRRLGGTVQVSDDAVDVTNGNAGISMAFAADFYARATVYEKSAGVFEVECMITKKPNTLFWICLIIGFFCIWPAWIVCVLYFVADPIPAYQGALDQIPRELE